jgi:hypothetical protein
LKKAATADLPATGPAPDDRKVAGGFGVRTEAGGLYI